jgi:RimJ/RimL family protein N-acetyltransferase
VVILRTGRLLLRPIEMGDCDALFEVYDDADVAEFIKPMNQAQTAAQTARFVAEWDQRGHGVMAVIEPVTGAFVGRSGLHYWPQFEEVEVGWVLRRDRWGLGYATEAGEASIAWGLTGLRVPYVTAIIAIGNRRSEAVAARLGMTVARRDVVNETPVQVFARAAERQTGPCAGDATGM